MIKKHTLPNGLRVIMEPIHSVRSVSIGIWVGTGSKYETEHDNGISHFIEHMLFKGTEKRSPRDIAEAFDSIGGQLNAFTSKEYTCYHAKILDDHLSTALEVLADIFFHSTFQEEELEKEKNVVLEELHMYDDMPDDIIHDLIAEATFKGHALGYNILGREDVLKRLTAEDLQAYMSAYYTPDNTVLALAGNFDEDKVLKIVERYFQHSGSAAAEATVLEPQITSEHLLRVKETEQSHFCIGLKGVHSADEKLYPLIVIDNVLGGSMSSRLFQEIREEQGLAYSVFSYHSCFQETGTLQIYAGTSDKNLEQVYLSCINIMQQLAETGLSEKELRHAKEQLKGNLVLSLESTNSRMSRIGRNELLLKEHLSLDDMIQRIDRLTLDEVNHLASELFTQPHSFALVSSMENLPPAINRDLLRSSSNSAL